MKRIQILDSHTGGEPTRLVIGGFPDLGAGSMAERRERLARGVLVNVAPTHAQGVKLYWHCWNLASDVLDGLSAALRREAATQLRQT